MDLYRRRQDKDWSLTDCISFVVMADEGLTESLTADRHFEQAGFARCWCRPSGRKSGQPDDSVPPAQFFGIRFSV